ncbi:MAG: dihydrolipoyl dehydrogenase [Coriobacteriia bacterium]|nr:dihydrolipoyl dehydrogenase [Coriobacteriia bacterium]
MRIIVLGGGPGGYSAAFEAARLGARVTLIEKDRLGGTCLIWGCIPTKTILRTARIVLDTTNAEEFGLDAERASLDLPRLRERKEGVVDELVGQLDSTARRLKVEVVRGVGRLTGPKCVEVELAEGGTAAYECEALILATGSVPLKLPAIDHTMPGVWTSDDAVALDAVPERVLLIGGGVIGLEFACAYAAFGSKVTVVEFMPTVLPGNDKRVTRAVQEALERLGVGFRLGRTVDSVERRGKAMRSTLDSGEAIESDVVFSAVGRMPNSAGMGFAEAGIGMDRAAVKADAYFRTNVPGVYAIGDLIAGMMLAHVAEEEGVCAARNAVSEAQAAEVGGIPELHTLDYWCIPACVYTFPEVAVIGSSRDSARERGLDAIQAVAKFAANGKALGEGEAEGFVQMVAEKGTGRILGCQIVGPHAVEIVHEVSVAMSAGVTVGGLAHATHAHPTVSEVVRNAASDAAEKCGL